jgi:hypothetical protein
MRIPEPSCEEAARVPPPELPATRPHSKDRDPGGDLVPRPLVILQRPRREPATRRTFRIHAATTLVSRMWGPAESAARRWRNRGPQIPVLFPRTSAWRDTDREAAPRARWAPSCSARCGAQSVHCTRVGTRVLIGSERH